MFTELHRDFRGYPFLADQAAAYPPLYSTEDVPASKKLIVARYFIGAASWWIAEYSADERLFFGFAYLGMDVRDAEWGYVNFEEIEGLKAQGRDGRSHLVHRDLEWVARPAAEAIPAEFHQQWWFE